MCSIKWINSKGSITLKIIKPIRVYISVVIDAQQLTASRKLKEITFWNKYNFK
jgi:hypothetical protein